MANRPNILLITSDQQHWNTIGKHHPELHTPRLDQLAREGTLFQRAYCPNPTCTPSRASLITGQYPSRHGAWSLGTKLPESATTVGGLLAADGYATGLIGKAHFQPLRSSERWPSREVHPLVRDLDYWKTFHGPFYGFDHVELARNHGDEAHVGQHYALWMEEKGLYDWRRHFENVWEEYDYTEGGPRQGPQYGAWTLPEPYHLNAWIAERSNAFLDQANGRDKPFFLWASFFDPHPPYLVPEPWASMYDPARLAIPRAAEGEHDDSPEYIRATQTRNPDFSRFQETPHFNHGVGSHLMDDGRKARNVALYYGMISMMDHYIGRIVDHLDRLGLREDTLIVFTSDHGHYFGQHGLVYKGPYHYEDGIRVPFIARWPGRIAAGRETPALQSLIDVPVTFLHAAGIEVPGSMQGVNQLPVWQGEEARARDDVLVEFRHQPTAIHMKTLVEERYKITVHYRQRYGELYDLLEDPGELHNLWDVPRHAALKSELLHRLIDAELGAEPLEMPRIAAA